MKIEIQIDENCSEPKIVIVTDKITDEVSELMQRLSAETQSELVGYRDGAAKLIDTADVMRVYAENGRVFAAADGAEYLLKLRLYEVEEKLNKKIFVRISNSEIVNLKKVKKLDLSFTGTICVLFCDGTMTYASRRYVSKIKKALGL